MNNLIPSNMHRYEKKTLSKESQYPMSGRPRQSTHHAASITASIALDLFFEPPNKMLARRVTLRQGGRNFDLKG
jgi:hypothetical protein